VEWFNQVDATYRQALRQQNDLNWARVEARFSQSEAALRSEIAQGMTAVRSEFHQELTGLRSDLDIGLGRLRSVLLKWMFLSWTGTALTVIGLVTALRAQFGRTASMRPKTSMAQPEMRCDSARPPLSSPAGYLTAPDIRLGTVVGSLVLRCAQPEPIGNGKLLSAYA